MKRAFTLIELLVVVSIIALLMGILLPVMGRARLQAKVLTVNAELREIGMALEAYSFDNDDKYPPTRVDCMLGGHFYQLPLELVDCGYLPAPGKDTFMAAGIEDRFNRGYTYKYRSVGELIYNRTFTIDDGSYLWVPDGFTDNEKEEGDNYYNQKESPVSWVLYSQGPKFDLDNMKELNYPVPRQTWYAPKTRKGVIVRMRLKNGNQIGSFENCK
ncbi:MAG: type II secretion system protein [Sedimentisphaerales bacterium]|nr:type II secretion system protein [Sedimentisphaerales bacterium]